MTNPIKYLRRFKFSIQAMLEGYHSEPYEPIRAEYDWVEEVGFV